MVITIASADTALKSQRQNHCGNAPKSRGDGSGKSFPRGLVSQTRRHSSAFAAPMERPEDIPLLVNHFLQKSAENLGVEPKLMSEEAMEFLKRFRFPAMFVN